MPATIARQPVDVVVTPDAQGVMSIMIDPCLDSLGVGRQKTIEEMLLPGIHNSEDGLFRELQPEAAILKQIYRITSRNQATVQLIQFLRDNDYLLSNGVIKSGGMEAAAEITITYKAKDGLGRWIEQTGNLATRGMETAKNAIVVCQDVEMVHPNVIFLESDQIPEALGSDADEVSGDTFYIPTPLASGALTSCAASETKQSTKLRVLLPNGYEFLVAWMRLNNRSEILKNDKW